MSGGRRVLAMTAWVGNVRQIRGYGSARGPDDCLSTDRESIASHEGLAKEAFEQLFDLVASRRCGIAIPMASLRSARVGEMSGVSGLGEGCPALGFPNPHRFPGECGSSHGD